MQSMFTGMAVVALLGIALLSAQAARPGVTVYEGAADLSERSWPNQAANLVAPH